MDRKWWDPRNVEQAYRDQGVDWSDDEIRERAERVAIEMRQMHWRALNDQRKIERHEVPCGLLHTEDDWNNLTVLAQRERVQREDWTREHKASRDLGQPHAKADG